MMCPRDSSGMKVVRSDPGGRDVDRDFCKWQRQQERNNHLLLCFLLFTPLPGTSSQVKCVPLPPSSCAFVLFFIDDVKQIMLLKPQL